MKEKIEEILADIVPDLDLSDPDLNLAEDMDSMDILTLIEELETAFDIELEMEDKTEENFQNPETLARMIENLKK